MVHSTLHSQVFELLLRLPVLVQTIVMKKRIVG